MNASNNLLSAISISTKMKSLRKLSIETRKKVLRGKEGSRTIAVEHSFMDFQYMIIGEKISKARTDGNFVFDELFLSKLMIQPESNVEFY